VPYLVGGISLVVLAIGSTAPGLLQFFTDKFSRVFPDYRARVLRHEAGHFLVRLPTDQSANSRACRHVEPPTCGRPPTPTAAAPCEIALGLSILKSPSGYCSS